MNGEEMRSFKYPGDGGLDDDENPMVKF